MAALQPVFGRLRWDLPEPLDPRKDYRRVLESHPFRLATLQQVIPMLHKVRFEMLDADQYLIGLPGGIVGDLRTGQTRQMRREDSLTRRLRITAKDEPTPIYDYFLRSISSANVIRPTKTGSNGSNAYLDTVCSDPCPTIFGRFGLARGATARAAWQDFPITY